MQYRPRLALVPALTLVTIGVLTANPCLAALGLTGPAEDREPVPVPALSAERASLLSRFVTPQTVGDPTASHPGLDPDHLVPKVLLDQAVSYYDANRDRIPNKKYLTVVDFTVHSRKTRLFIADMTTGKVEALHVAHGTGSDPGDSGVATHFSNTVDSHMSSLGFYLTAETVEGSHGLSLCLDGLSPTNSRAREREILVHGADYVEDSNVKQGMSWGCFALSIDSYARVINGIKGGSVIFAGLTQ